MINHKRMQRLSFASLLIAIGVIIPTFSPLKVIIEPASFTLASHVAIFVAMFISPAAAAAVSAGTAIGFFLGGFPLIIVLRASTHVIFAFSGAYYLHRVAKGTLPPLKMRIFSLVFGLVHAFGEVVVVSFFFFGAGAGNSYYNEGYLTSVLLLVGLGTVIHSMVDFEIAHIITLPLKKQKDFKVLFERIHK